MNKLLFVLFTLFIVTACNSSTLSISEIEYVPDEIQDKIDSTYTLQLISEGENTSYIVFHSKGTVETDLETQGDTLLVKLDETDEQEEVEQNVYKLTLDPNHEVIEVLVNGKSMSFDNVTHL